MSAYINEKRGPIEIIVCENRTQTLTRGARIWIMATLRTSGAFDWAISHVADFTLSNAKCEETFARTVPKQTLPTNLNVVVRNPV